MRLLRDRAPDQFAIVVGDMQAVLAQDRNDVEREGDTELLQAISSGSGGSTSTAETAGELDEVYDALGARLSSELAVGSSALPLLVASVVLTVLAVGTFLGLGRRG